MNTNALIDTAEELLAGDRGILAMDESVATCNRRLAVAGIEQSFERRRDYRELLVTTPGLGESVRGAILYDETIRQSGRDGTPLIAHLTDSGIIPGIKVDTGTVPLAGHPGELVTQGLDGLRERLTDYAPMGARFAKWRAVFSMGDGTPSHGCVEANVGALARYAALCQEAGLVPIVEPELLMEGDHAQARCEAVTERILRALFTALHAQGVVLEAMVLKPNMVLPGADSDERPNADEVADTTLACLRRAVPAAVPGIAFLSGGQSDELASARLCAMNSGSRATAPWALSFSFGRALQRPALALWHGQDANVEEAQLALLHRARCNQMARRGEYSLAVENAATTVERATA